MCLKPNEAKKAGPAPKHIPSLKSNNAPVSPISQASPVATSANLGPFEYGVLVPQGAVSPPQGAAAAVMLSPGYPAGTFMIPRTPLVSPGSPKNNVAETLMTNGEAKKGKKKKTKEGIKEPEIKVTKKTEKKKVEKKKEKRNKMKHVSNPEKTAPTFTIQVPEYMRANQSPVVHGNGVPYGFISSAPSVYSSGSSIPSFTTSPPPSYAPGYSDSPTYDYYSNISAM